MKGCFSVRKKGAAGSWRPQLPGFNEETQFSAELPTESNSWQSEYEEEILGNVLVLKSQIFGKFGLKWVAVARFGLKMGGNESHKVQDHF